MLSLGGFITHPVVLTVLAVVAVVGCAATIWAILRSPTKADTDAIAQQIKDLESKVTLGPEYLDGLPEAVNQKLRAAYQEARILQLEGYEAQSREKHEEAIDRFTRALALAETDSQRAALHLLRGNSYENVSEYAEAEADFHEMLRLAANIGLAREADQVRGIAIGSLGNIHFHRYQLPEAEERYSTALEIARRLDNRASQAQILGNLGNLYMRRDRLTEAEESHEMALAISRQLGDQRSELQDLGNLANVYRLRGENRRAEEQYRRVLEMSSRIGYRLGEANSLLALAHVVDLGDPRQEGYCEQALEIYTRIGNREGEANARSQLGFVYAQRGELDVAEKCHRDAMRLFTGMGDLVAGADELRNLALVHVLRGELDQAKEAALAAEAIYRQHDIDGKRHDIMRQLLEGIERTERQQRDGGEEV